MEITKTVSISRSAREISDYCCRYENQSKILGTQFGLNRGQADKLHWQIRAPFGVELEGELHCQIYASGLMLIWNSTEEIGPKFEIVLEIFEVCQNEESEVSVTYRTESTPGSLCCEALLMAGLRPERMITSVLTELKQNLEAEYEYEDQPQEFFTTEVWANRAFVF